MYDFTDLSVEEKSNRSRFWFSLKDLEREDNSIGTTNSESATSGNKNSSNNTRKPQLHHEIAKDTCKRILPFFKSDFHKC